MNKKSGKKEILYPDYPRLHGERELFIKIQQETKNCSIVEYMKN